MHNTKEKLIEIAGNVLNYLPWGEITQHTAEDIADRIIESELFENIEQFKWISVKDRLPDETKDEYVLAVCNYHGKIEVETRKMWHIDSVVTHWMPLPQPPKGE